MDLLQSYHRASHEMGTAQAATKKIAGFAYRERNKPTDNIPLGQRITLLRRGYHSTRAEDYDLDQYDLSDYLPDYSGAVSPGSLAGRDAPITKNKLTFYQILSNSHTDAIPDVFGVIDNNSVYSYQGNFVTNDVSGWVRELLMSGQKVVCKPIAGVGGADVYILEMSNGDVIVNGDRTSLTSWSSRLDAKASYLVTEFVQQADYADEICPNSTNTIRALTLRDVHTNEPFVARAIHRIGVNESAPVDNWDKGGISANIDISSGELTSVAQNTDSGIEWIESHPDTGNQISGTTIPDWDSVQDEITSMASHLQQLPLIGWDIVLTEDGLRVLEGNIRPTHDMMQIHEPFLTDPRIRAFFEYYNVV